MNTEEITKIIEKNRMLESDNRLHYLELKKKNKVIAELEKQLCEKDTEIADLKDKVYYQAEVIEKLKKNI